jgi:hypothetical protein
MLGLYPIFALEEGVFTPMEKVKNTGISSIISGIVDEFEDLQHIAMMQSQPPAPPNTTFSAITSKKPIPKPHISVHPINLRWQRSVRGHLACTDGSGINPDYLVLAE